MDELNGRMMACQIPITGLIARVANEQPDPLRFFSDFRDEVKAVVRESTFRHGQHRSRPPGRAIDSRRIVFADEGAEYRLMVVKAVIRLVPDFTAFLSSL